MYECVRSADVNVFINLRVFIISYIGSVKEKDDITVLSYALVQYFHLHASFHFVFVPITIHP